MNNQQTRVSITGHRPERIPDTEIVREALAKAFITLGANTVIQGMAAGVDLLAAEVAFSSHIPFWCVKPWAGHQPRSRDYLNYVRAMTLCERAIVVNPSEKYIGPWLYQRRNEWMVDNGDILLAVWDGIEKGGTWNCIEYAVGQRKTIYRIDPVTGELSRYCASSL